MIDPLPGALRQRLAVLGAGPRRLALLWAALVFALAAALGGGPGISADEAATFSAAVPALGGGAAAPELAPLPALLARLSHAALGGLSHLHALRLPAAAAAALLAAGVAFLAHRLAGRSAALLAPGLALLAPRLLHAALTAPQDALAAALGLATVIAYRRSAAAPTALRRLQAGVATGVLFGLAVAARLDAALLLPALALHALLAPALRRRRAVNRGEPPPPPARPSAWGPHPPRTEPQHTPVEALRAVTRPEVLEAGLRGIPFALAGMVVAGPLVVALAWPWLLGAPLHPLQRPLAAVAALRGLPAGAGLAALLPHPRAWGAPALETALALPAALGLAFAAGLVHALFRLVRAVRGAPGVSDELLLLIAALAPLASAQLGLSPPGPGLRPWLLSFPFLAVLAARATVSAAHHAWPRRAGALTAALTAGLLLPSLVAAVHAWPHGGSAWGELAGGAPGAASAGRPRQEGGEAAVALLPELAARARPGARVALAGVAPAAARLYALDGRLRPDLALVERPEEADLVLAALDGRSRDAEYQAWSALQTATPAAAAFLDDVPLAFVYARPGAWR
ncbi:MAG: glycosyltransferase family 39 protein [Anaeromyxobacter sp.]